MPKKPVFALVADAIRKELEPQGFHIHVQTNNGKIRITDHGGLTWVVGILGGPYVGE